MRSPGSTSVIVVSTGEEGTRRIAAGVSRAANAGDFIALVGELGTGKTQFVKGFSEGLGVPPEVVDSPSFVLLNEYEGRLPVFHFDAYRLEGDPEELSEAGFFDERLAEGVVLVEWADRMSDYIPEHALWIRIAIEEKTQRRLICLHEPSPYVRGYLPKGDEPFLFRE